MMRDFPSCFGENGVQVADSSSSSSSRITKIAQNLVSCVYQCKLQGRLCFITVTWTKNLMGQGLSIEIDDAANQCICKVDIKPWLFSKRKGCRNLEVDTSKIDIYWDLTNAKFGSGPEPLEKFYLAVMFNQEMVLLLGDLKREAFNKDPVGSISRATFIAKREHIFGKKFYGAKAQFCDKGKSHDVTIECETVGLHEPYLVICIDSKMVMQVKRLNWKFRGNHTILVDGLRIEVFWDVHNWLFGNAMGNAVFMFQTCLSDDNKFWTSPPVLDPSVLAWSSSQPLRDNQLQGLGFSLVLHAWKNE
ncbi:PREDICTED: Protein of unknown function DUF868 [Prunus dulcis]|uniref:DUF868 family protein n=1 Tax=Prunus dulcis TaxID=3755 RepID=A0A5E4EEQ9_PRUDU|nr:uncharacterized protein LOC117637796 [Prunus dulcis]KAI5315957.1 hypothetical protein L3X38_045133 [Prunus dulcis]VVA13946.1 PREDICTED: Protein of unknown function DUF868 [Prunus dulcis]